MYLASVDAAAPALAAERDDISFIHPLGHEEGWEQMKSNVCVKLMGGLFSARKLKIERITVKPHGDSAVVEFYWNFSATLRQDGSFVTTRGRETQVLLRDSKRNWKLAHVHYSEMPVKPS
ncbi:MAG: nuclear transport factor 2 family protein [Acidobacteriia bacterium]|nr:nuclear transport factor 2 family protein [Terriglobia bacterium]